MVQKVYKHYTYKAGILGDLGVALRSYDFYWKQRPMEYIWPPPPKKKKQKKNKKTTTTTTKKKTNTWRNYMPPPSPALGRFSFNPPPPQYINQKIPIPLNLPTHPHSHLVINDSSLIPHIRNLNLQSVIPETIVPDTPWNKNVNKINRYM